MDVLLNNAASQYERSLTPEGIEPTFAVNVLAPFLLTNLLIDKLQSSAPSRIVNVSSSRSNRAKLDFDNLQSQKKSSGFNLYGQSKLALNVITVEFSRRLAGKGVTANFLHPGVIRTELGRNASPLLKPLALFLRMFMADPEKDALTSIYLASSPEVEGVTGKYFANQKQVKANPLSYDESIAKRLWKVCEGLTVSPKT